MSKRRSALVCAVVLVLGLVVALAEHRGEPLVIAVGVVLLGIATGSNYCPSRWCYAVSVLLGVVGFVLWGFADGLAFDLGHIAFQAACFALPLIFLIRLTYNPEATTAWTH